MIEINISMDLERLYANNHRNYDMAIMTLLDSLDQSSYQKAFEIVSSFTVLGETSRIKIGDAAEQQIKTAFENTEVNDDLIQVLLWIAVLFPEV